jgi:hypothetical protein
MSTTFDKKYHASKNETYPDHIQTQIIDLPNELNPKLGKHANDRIDKNKYLKNEDIHDSSVSIIVPPKIDIHNSWVFEVKSTSIGSFESIWRIGVRLTNKPVVVSNTNNNYSQYEYCFILELDTHNPYQQNVKLVTVYLNRKGDYHGSLDKSVYTNK